MEWYQYTVNVTATRQHEKYKGINLRSPTKDICSTCEASFTYPSRAPAIIPVFCRFMLLSFLFFRVLLCVLSSYFAMVLSFCFRFMSLNILLVSFHYLLNTESLKSRKRIQQVLWKISLHHQVFQNGFKQAHKRVSWLTSQINWLSNRI